MAAGIAKKLLEEKRIANIEVESAGVASYPDSPASLFAVETCRDFGIDISQHSSRQLTLKVAQHADLILVMTPEHLHYISELSPELADKTFLLKAFPSTSRTGQDYSVKDPIGGDRQAYLSCYFDLDENLRRILPLVLEMAGEK
jgi:protein-tyrosine-phosphatase